MNDIAKARAKRAIEVFRDLRIADQLYAPAPGGLSAEDANALVEAGLAHRGRTVGKQQLIILSAAGIAARDGA